jgi:hypothetical protein
MYLLQDLTASSLSVLQEVNKNTRLYKDISHFDNFKGFFKGAVI